MWIIFDEKEHQIVGFSAVSDFDQDKQTAITEIVSGLVKPGKLENYDAIQVTDPEKAHEYLQSFPEKLVLTGTKAKPKISIREPEIFSLYVATDASDKHPVDGIPEIPADGESSVLITVQKIDERKKLQQAKSDHDQIYLRTNHGILRDKDGKKDINSIQLVKGKAEFRLFSESLKRVATIDIFNQDQQFQNAKLSIEFI